MTLKFTSGIQPTGQEAPEEQITKARYSNQYEIQTVGGLFTEGDLTDKAQKMGMDLNTYMGWLNFAQNFNWMPEQLFNWLQQEKLNPQRLTYIFNIAVESGIPFNEYYYKYYKRGVVHPKGKNNKKKTFQEVTNNVQMSNAYMPPQGQMQQNNLQPDPSVPEIMEDIKPVQPKQQYYPQPTQQEVQEAGQYGLSPQQYKVLKPESIRLNLTFNIYLQLRGKCQRLNISVDEYLKEFGFPKQQQQPPQQPQRQLPKNQMPIENVNEPSIPYEDLNTPQQQPQAPQQPTMSQQVITETNAGKTKDRQLFVEDPQSYQKKQFKRPPFSNSYVGPEQQHSQVGSCGVIGHAGAGEKKQPVFGDHSSGELKEKSNHSFGDSGNTGGITFN